MSALTTCELGLSELGNCRLGFAPRDSRPLVGVGPFGPRYAWVAPDDVVPFVEEEEVAGILNLEIEQGATFLHTIRVQNVDGTPVDLTGSLALLQVRKAKSTTADHILSLSSYAAPPAAPQPWRVDIGIEGSEGKITILTSAAATAALPPGAYFYDLKVTLAGGEVRRIVEGQMVVDPAVSA